MKTKICIVDCRIDDKLERDFFSLCLWGKYSFEYPITEVLESGVFEKVFLLTDSDRIARFAEEKYGKAIDIISDMSDFDIVDRPFMLLSGRAVAIKGDTLKDVVSCYKGNCLVSAKVTNVMDFGQSDSISFISGQKLVKTNVFAVYDSLDSMKKCGNKAVEEYVLNDSEALVINSINDFELALILIKKANQQMVCKEIVLNRIKEKKNILENSIDKDSVCLVGHSQLDYWNIDRLGGHVVRNCGILAIDSKQYFSYILANGCFNCDSSHFIFMLGTNDITTTPKVSEITENIKKVVDFIAGKAPMASLLFLACTHVRGRMDRDNKVIDCLNESIKNELNNTVTWIDTSFLNDDSGEIAQCNTIDGLHLSDEAYDKLQTVLEKYIK